MSKRDPLSGASEADPLSGAVDPIPTVPAHFHSEKCYAIGPGDTVVLICEQDLSESVKGGTGLEDRAGKPPLGAQSLPATSQPVGSLKDCHDGGSLNGPSRLGASPETDTGGEIVAVLRAQLEEAQKGCEICRSEGVKAQATVCEWHYKKATQREADTEAAHTALCDALKRLEQDIRRRGLGLCPDLKPSRLGCADDLAAVLARHGGKE